jgi:hypothetical protein
MSEQRQPGGCTTFITSLIFIIAIMALLGGCVQLFNDSWLP